MKELKINEIVIFQDRIYKIELAKIKGNRVIFKLLNDKELINIIKGKIKQ